MEFATNSDAPGSNTCKLGYGAGPIMLDRTQIQTAQTRGTEIRGNKPGRKPRYREAGLSQTSWRNRRRVFRVDTSTWQQART